MHNDVVRTWAFNCSIKMTLFICIMDNQPQCLCPIFSECPNTNDFYPRMYSNNGRHLHVHTHARTHARTHASTHAGKKLRTWGFVHYLQSE